MSALRVQTLRRWRILCLDLERDWKGADFSQGGSGGCGKEHRSNICGLGWGWGTRTGDLNRAQGLDSDYSHGRRRFPARVYTGTTALALGKTHTQACSGQ